MATLSAEALKLRDAVSAGKLDVRGDVDRVDREFQPIVSGMNDTMDAFAKPIEVTAEYVVRISKGDIPPPITDRYEGELNRIKEALNRCVGSISGIVSEMNRMSASTRRATSTSASRLRSSRARGDAWLRA